MAYAFISTLTGIDWGDPSVGSETCLETFMADRRESSKRLTFVPVICWQIMSAIEIMARVQVSGMVHISRIKSFKPCTTNELLSLSSWVTISPYSAWMYGWSLGRLRTLERIVCACSQRFYFTSQRWSVIRGGQLRDQRKESRLASQHEGRAGYPKTWTA